VLELVLHQYERIRSHVGVKQCAVPVISFAAVEHQLSGEVVVTNSAGQVVPGMRPGLSSCLYIGRGNTIPENGE
jgi:hypothetical protein